MNMDLRKSGMIALLATALFTAGCAVSPDSSDNPANAYTELGMGYLAQGDAERAGAALNEALQRDGNHASALHGMALLAQGKGDMQSADDYYQQALENIGGQNSNESGHLSEPQVRNNYAALLFEQGEFSRACSQLEQAGADTDHDGRAGILVNLSQCRLREGNNEQARAALTEAERIAPNQPTVIIARAYQEFADGNLNASREFLSQYRELEGTTPESDMLEQALSQQQ